MPKDCFRLTLLAGALALAGAAHANVTPKNAPAVADATGAGVAAPAAASTDFRYLRYQADYVVDAQAGSVQTETREVLLNTRSAVEQFSQVRLSYSEKMETLEVLEAYTVDAQGQRRDVAADRIYTQESYSSASAAMYADRKVRIIVFPSLAPGSRLVYSTRRSQHQPYFPGYFSLWEAFSVFTEYEQAQVTLTAPAGLPMRVRSRGLEGADTPRIRDGLAHWQWRHRRAEALPVQNWTAAAWEYSPGVMASTYQDWAQVARAYQANAGAAAEPTPAIRALAAQLTAGISDRRQQVDVLYRWVAQNIRYVAVYLGNGGLEPNTAQSILDTHYGDCKDHVVILQALLAAAGIDSSPVLIGAGGGPTLPDIPVLGRFNHAITYVPEFDLYLDSTSVYARPGQLPAADLGAPVLLTTTGTLARTPPASGPRSGLAFSVDIHFERNGDLQGQTRLQPGDSAEIGLRGAYAQVNAQNRARIENSLLSSSGFDGQGALELLGDPQDLTRPFNMAYRFQARDYVDFNLVGGMQLPDPPAVESMRGIYANASAESNATPFYCTASLRQETYRLRLPEGVPILAVPADIDFSNAAGSYSAQWRRDGQTVVATHRLRESAVRGDAAICQAEDYPAFRALYQQVRRGFRGQLVYGRLPEGAGQGVTALP